MDQRMTKLKTISPIPFYNAIAQKYNHQLNGERDVMTRLNLASFFKQNVAIGSVLDFGGGTGLDLPWLLEAGFDVYFCEPADKMRQIAEEFTAKNNSKKKAIFLGADKMDFHIWNERNLPLDTKVSAILANFGVLNYIQDLSLLFQKFGLVLENGGVVVISLLQPKLFKLISKHFWSVTKALWSGEPIKMVSQHDGQVHHAIIHSMAAVQRACSIHFEIKTYRRIHPHSDFLLVHLVKK